MHYIDVSFNQNCFRIPTAKRIVLPLSLYVSKGQLERQLQNEKIAVCQLTVEDNSLDYLSCPDQVSFGSMHLSSSHGPHNPVCDIPPWPPPPLPPRSQLLILPEGGQLTVCTLVYLNAKYNVPDRLSFHFWN